MRHLLFIFLLIISLKSNAQACVAEGNADAVLMDALVERIFPTEGGSSCSLSKNDAIEAEYRKSKLADSTYRDLKAEVSAVDGAEPSFLVVNESELSSFSFEQISIPDLRIATQVRTVSGYTTIDPSE